MQSRQPTTSELKDRIAVLEGELRVVRGTVHTILHGLDTPAADCQDSPCKSIGLALSAPICRSQPKPKPIITDDEHWANPSDGFTSSLDENAPSYANNKDWDTSDEDWNFKDIGGTTSDGDGALFWDRISQACEHLMDGESKSFHLKRSARGQKISKMNMRARLIPFLRSNGGSDMRWKITEDDNGGIYVAIRRGKAPGFSLIPDQGYYFAPHPGGAKLRHPGVSQS